ncbi:MAG: FAD-dependent oxidoreductase [Firmicutes bacterium]|nr:FAD-dependent oxidoreductase [Bacillota bacterium]
MNNLNNNKASRGWAHSLWIDTTPDTNYPALEQGIEVDTAVIGGGITGITTALLLKQAGQKVALIEMHRIAKSTTGHTTAKLSSLQGLKYQTLLSNFSADKVRIYAKANQFAIDKIASIVSDQKIDCDFKRTSAYTYTESKKNIRAIEKEVEATQKVGLNTSFFESADLPFEIRGAVYLDNQAQFHPRKYLLVLSSYINNGDSYIFENTRVVNIDDGNPCIITTDQGKIRARNVVLATAFPFKDTGHFYTKLYPYYFYLTGMRINSNVPEGMYYGIDDDAYTIRNHPTKDGPLLIVGSGHHKTGQGGDTFKWYQRVENYAKERFDVESIDYYWSTEDYRTPDGIPYIGRLPKAKHIYMASGFGGWGMTNSMVAAIIISDEILEKDNPWASFFSPSRHDIAQYGATFLTEGINIVEQYGKEYLVTPKKMNPADLQKGEGKLIAVDNKKIAAYKDEEGNIYTLSTKCVHMGCLVNWNGAEKTWDCTCHGSRYSYNGELIHGPALADLPEAEDLD